MGVQGESEGPVESVGMSRRTGGVCSGNQEDRQGPWGVAGVREGVAGLWGSLGVRSLGGWGGLLPPPSGTRGCF